MSLKDKIKTALFAVAFAALFWLGVHLQNKAIDDAMGTDGDSPHRLDDFPCQLPGVNCGEELWRWLMGEQK